MLNLAMLISEITIMNSTLYEETSRSQLINFMYFSNPKEYDTKPFPIQHQSLVLSTGTNS